MALARTIAAQLVGNLSLSLSDVAQPAGAQILRYRSGFLIKLPTRYYQVEQLQYREAHSLLSHRPHETSSYLTLLRLLRKRPGYIKLGRSVKVRRRQIGPKGQWHHRHRQGMARRRKFPGESAVWNYGYIEWS